MREIYILATEQAEPVALPTLREALESDEVELIAGEGELLFTLSAGDSQVTVRFESRADGLAWTPDLVTGSDDSHALLRRARGFYRFGIEPGKPQPSVAVFEALWCARTVMEHVEGVLLDVTSFKLHDPEDVVEITELEFDIRDHLNLHAVEITDGDKPLWVHTHGMTKFGLRDVEAFHLGEQDLRAVETFLQELCTDLVFGQGPVERKTLETSEGHAFMLAPSEEARTSLMGVPLESFEGHETSFLTVVSPEGRHNVAEMLRPYLDRFAKESPEEAKNLQDQASALLPAFKARFQRRGLMEPLVFLVRAPFESHPEGEATTEDLWCEVVTWEEGVLVGKLVDGSAQTTEWRKGAHVEFEEDQINALAVSREGKALDEDEMKALLLAERPA